MVKLKFNGGYGALLCENCGVIIATSARIPEQYKRTNPNGDLIFVLRNVIINIYRNIRVDVKLLILQDNENIQRLTSRR